MFTPIKSRCYLLFIDAYDVLQRTFLLKGAINIELNVGLTIFGLSSVVVRVHNLKTFELDANFVVFKTLNEKFTEF